MQVLLCKHTKLNMHTNLYVYETNTKLGPPTFVTQELYATTHLNVLAKTCKKKKKKIAKSNSKIKTNCLCY
jgi:hypothetical protein